MLPYTTLKERLFQQFEQELGRLGFKPIGKSRQGTVEKPHENNFILSTTVLVDKVGQGFTCQFVIGLRHTELLNCLDKETAASMGRDLKHWPLWAENLINIAEPGTPLDEYIESPEDIPLLVKIFVKTLSQKGLTRALSMANLSTLADMILTGTGPGTVQYRFQPIVLATTGHKAEAINWIQTKYLSESSWEQDKKIGSLLLSNPLFHYE